jgi:hypothetical protein
MPDRVGGQLRDDQEDCLGRVVGNRPGGEDASGTLPGFGDVLLDRHELAAP